MRKFDLEEKSFVSIKGDYNNDLLYNMFNEMTGLELEFDIEQEYGTECLGTIGFTEGHRDETLEEIERKISANQAAKTAGDPEDIHWKDEICINDIVEYFRYKGILPDKDFLFAVSY